MLQVICHQQLPAELQRDFQRLWISETAPPLLTHLR
jgi:hypothetical protein